jgi:branched-chain amino acid transport system permease protein
MGWAVRMIVMRVLGGLATLAGRVVGAVVIYGLQQVLLDFQTLSTLLVGVLLVVMVCLAPEGLVGAFNRLWDMRTGIRPESRIDVDESTELRERSLPI